MTDHDTHILDRAAETVYERPDDHGSPEDSFTSIAAFWSDYLDIEVTASDVANMMILLKVARNKEGHYHADNWVDLAGYAENGARLERQERAPTGVNVDPETGDHEYTYE